MVALSLVAGVLGGVGIAAAANPEFDERPDVTWMTNGVGRVYSIDTGANRVFVGGTFTGMRETYNGATVDQKYVAALDMWTGDLIAAFDPVVNAAVNAVAVSPDGSVVYIGGKFTTVNGTTRTKVAALNAANGNVIAGFNVTIPSSNVDSLAVTASGDLFIGGSFASVNGHGQRALALVDGQTGSLKSFDADIATGRVRSLLLTNDESRLYIGTSIDDPSGRPTDGHLYAVNPVTGSAISGFNTSAIIDPVLDIAVSDAKVYVAMGGGGGEAQILRVSNGSRLKRFVTDGDVQAVEVIGDRAYFAGHWVDHFGSTASFHFVSIDIDTDDVETSYLPKLIGTNGLRALHYDGYHFWMGGEVRDGNPIPRRGFGRFSPTGGLAGLTPVVDTGAEWTYLDDGSQLGSSWRNLGFDDDGWRRGAAELGYGDGDETTVVRDGPNQSRYITTYFRRVVTIYDHSDVDRLIIELKRDDGAVVYINGTEVIRDNMPSGAISGATLASSSIDGGGEDVFLTWVLSPQVLVEGENIVAVEIHQASPTSDDISFDMRMLIDTHPQTFIDSGATWRYRDNGVSPGSGWSDLGFDDSSWSEGPSQLGYGEGDEQTVINAGPAGDRHITSYFRRVFTIYDLQAVGTLELELLRDDGAVVYLNGVEVVRSNMPAGAINGEVTSRRVSNGKSEKRWYRYSIDPALLEAGDNVLAVEIHQIGPRSQDHSFDVRLARQASSEELIAAGAVWRYHDKGVAKNAAWRWVHFRFHSKWKKGRAQLGFGDGDEATVIESGPAGDRHTTTYFRRKFAVPDPDVFDFLDISLVRDDGAVIYVNNVEVLRSNMPSGTITYDTFASGGASGENNFHDFRVPASSLRKGINVIAVEIHQSSPGSSDLSFDLQLVAR